MSLMKRDSVRITRPGKINPLTGLTGNDSVVYDNIDCSHIDPVTNAVEYQAVTEITTYTFVAYLPPRYEIQIGDRLYSYHKLKEYTIKYVRPWDDSSVEALLELVR